MLVAFLSLVTGTSPTICLMKAFAAFLVFAGLGLILRHALTVEAEEEDNDVPVKNRVKSAHNLDMIVPGTSVAELLAHPTETPSNASGNDAQAA